MRESPTGRTGAFDSRSPRPRRLDGAGSSLRNERLPEGGETEIRALK
jgi:hypothetical protein